MSTFDGRFGRLVPGGEFTPLIATFAAAVISLAIALLRPMSHMFRPTYLSHPCMRSGRISRVTARVLRPPDSSMPSPSFLRRYASIALTAAFRAPS